LVKAVVLVKSPKKLIAVKLKQINSVYESFPVSWLFDAFAVIEVKNLSEIKNLFNSKIFFHNNFNGKILVNIDSLSNIKLF